MKKLCLFVLLSSFYFSGFAQFDIGGGISLSTERKTKVGFNARAGLGVGESSTVMLGYTYFLDRNASLMSIDGNLHYDFVQLGDVVTIQGVIGINVYVTNIRNAAAEDDGDVGINLGGNIFFELESGAKIYIEPKYVVDGVNGFVVTGGVMF